MSIVSIIGLILKFVFGLFNPERCKKIRKEHILAEFKRLEDAHAQAWAEGAPLRAARIAKRLDELREQIRYVEAME